jgi:hypothetical protein
MSHRRQRIKKRHQAVDVFVAHVAERSVGHHWKQRAAIAVMPSRMARIFSPSVHAPTFGTLEMPLALMAPGNSSSAGIQSLAAAALDHRPASGEIAPGMAAVAIRQVEQILAALDAGLGCLDLSAAAGDYRLEMQIAKARAHRKPTHPEFVSSPTSVRR